MRQPLTLLLLAVLGAGALGGCSGDEEPDRPGSAPTVATTPLSEYDTGEVVVARSPFCDRISSEAVRDALGDAADETDAWAPGQALAAEGAPRDVGHEFGCAWTTDDGLAATAWLFAPPVTPDQARALLEDVPGCWSAPGEAFGQPSAAIRCGGGPGSAGRVELGHRGLFGDAWLSCSLSSPAAQEPEDLVERAERWCVQVVEAVRVR